MHVSVLLILVLALVCAVDSEETGLIGDAKLHDAVFKHIHRLEKEIERLVEKHGELEKRNEDMEKENRRLVDALAQFQDYGASEPQVGGSINDALDKAKASTARKEDTDGEYPDKLADLINISKDKDTKRRRRDVLSGIQVAVSTQVHANLRPVAFSALVSAYSLSHMHSNMAIVFDQTVTNAGEAYNNVTGVFTAPVSGIYVFNFAVMMEPGNDEYVELVDDGLRIVHCYVTAVGESRYVSSTRTVTAHVYRGSEVWVNAYHGANIIHGNGYTTFSGWLVSSDN